MGWGRGVSCYIQVDSGVSCVCDVSGVKKHEVEQRNRKISKGRERTKGSRKEEESLLSCVLTRPGREWLLFPLPKLASAGSIALAAMPAGVGKCH